MISCRTFLIALFIAALPALAAEPPAPMAEHPRIGLSENMQTAANAEIHYKLYLPPAYEQDRGRLFPMVITQNPGGRTRLTPYVKWAESDGVILLGIDGIKNGLDQAKKNSIADGTLKDLVARGVRAHPTLRFAIGMSGGSADGMRLVRRRPEGYAGLVLMGAGGVLDGNNAKHLGWAILGGAKDEWMAGDACYAMAEKAKTLGCPVRIAIGIDRQHKEAPIEQQLEALTWIIEIQKLRMPTLPEAERSANLAAARERMKKAGAISDATSRRKEAELLLDLDPLKQFTAEWRLVGDAWASAMLELARAEKDPKAQHAFLMVEVLGSSHASELPEPARKRFEHMAGALRSSPAVAKDWSIRERFLKAEDAERHAGIKPEKLKEVLPPWETLAKDTAGTDWEAKVARRISIVKQLIETPSTIQNPTKIK